MQALDCEKLQVEPDTITCTTERITSDLSRCYRNNNKCKYGLYAGKTIAPIVCIRIIGNF
jgi:hypothetical protein